VSKTTEWRHRQDPEVLRAKQREYQDRPEVREKRKVWNRRWKAKHVGYDRNTYRRRNYNADPEWQVRALAIQEGKCPITGQDVCITSDLDHDHRSGKPRAFLALR
jgi:hypothetical protein